MHLKFRAHSWPVLLLAILVAPHAIAAPDWIWSTPLDKAKSNEQVYFRKTFELTKDVKKATLYGTCDNGMTVWVNGKESAKSNEWQSPVKVDVKGHLYKGANVIAVHGRNDAGNTAGLFLKLELELGDGSKQAIESGASWKFVSEKPKGWRRAALDDKGWATVVVLGPEGSGPWGKLGTGGAPRQKEEALASQGVTAPDGFKVERIYNVPKDEQGSWISLAKDPRGRLIVSDQGDKGLYRIDVSDTEAKVEKISVDISSAHGLLWAFDSLYAHVSGKGLYRLTDTNGDDQLDAMEDLGGSRGGGEHGNHAVVLTEDKQGLYIVGGNHTDLPDRITGSRLPAEKWHEDLLLPRRWDARGHARGRLAPGGWICRITPDAQKWDIVSVGYRNQYDVALNRHGEMFTYDADMEWDMGMPWYRPTRICHVVSGSEFGWRSGTGKWPGYYEDSLPATVDIGPGCPTGTVFGTGAKFPAKYQEALYALDWTFGTIWAVHLKPDGASYTAEKEDFLSGSPLPVTDALVGDDGALYFTVGGRNTQSALYRVTYEGKESTAQVTGDGDPEAAQARGARRRLEQYHGQPHPDAVNAAWPYLGVRDRFLRYAARVAIEAQPVYEWQVQALTEPDLQTRITASIALARVGHPAVKGALLASLGEIGPATLTEPALLGLLRAYSLCFTRFGAPDSEEAATLIAQFDPLLPSSSDAVSLELVEMLVYLDAPSVVEKGLALMTQDRAPTPPDWSQVLVRNGGYGGGIQKMLDSPPPTQGLAYAFALRNVRYGWSLDQRRTYLTFLKGAEGHPGGASYNGFIENMRADSLENSSHAERAALADVTGKAAEAVVAFQAKPPKGPGKAWTVDEAVDAIGTRLTGRNFESGRNLFHATACASCHLFNGEGGAIGPDLSSVRNKFSHRDLLESIIEPSKVISDQYGSKEVALKNGKTHAGLVVEKKDAGTLEIYLPDPKTPPVIVKASDVASVKDSPISQMPPALVHTLCEEEMLDLVAYLMSRGNRKDSAFQ
ncbi:MAG: c-type cytochrome [Verrucomicrobiales bacterium]